MIDIAMLTAISGVILAIVALYNGISTGRKSVSGAASEIVQAALGLVGPLQERLAVVEERVTVLTRERDDLKSQVAERDNKIARLEAKVDLLSTQIIALGHKPIDIG